jgi:uncharacterized protein (UPF0147 family)
MNHCIGKRISTCRFFVKIMHILPSKSQKKQCINIIVQIGKNNGFPRNITQFTTKIKRNF